MYNDTFFENLDFAMLNVGREELGEPVEMEQCEYCDEHFLVGDECECVVQWEKDVDEYNDLVKRMAEMSKKFGVQHIVFSDVVEPTCFVDRGNVQNMVTEVTITEFNGSINKSGCRDGVKYTSWAKKGEKR